MFEIEPTADFRPAGAGQIAGKVRDAVAPAVEAAKEVLDKVKELRPDAVEVTFGIKVSGGAQWLVAKAACEGSFEVTLTWSASSGETVAVPPAGVEPNEVDVDGDSGADLAKERTQ